MWHGYLAIENLNLNDAQRAELVAELQALGPSTHPSPACLNHWRTRPDGQAAIFEAQFITYLLTVDAFKSRLGVIFDVDPGTIDHATTAPIFDRRPTLIVTFSRTGTDYLRMALFGGPSANYRQSRAEARAFLALYAADWGDEEPE
jgi:hypothetical protein